MTDAPPKKRAWFQLHLITCVVLMVVAGALVWVNLRARPVDFHHNGQTHWFERGWPWKMFEARRGWQPSLEWKEPENVAIKGPVPPTTEDPGILEGEWWVKPLLMNLVVAVTLLACAVVGWEFLVRMPLSTRREPAP
ncbi:MAG: hypothetical protein L6R28_23645 [Planctomycetes bacterium]|nr:hypothetical protein [Planctomycetota bacterium]